MSELEDKREIVRVEVNDVIILKDDSLMTLPEEQFNEFMGIVQAHFPKNLVIIMGPEDTLETMPIDVVRTMLEDLIAHEEALQEEAPE